MSSLFSHLLFMLAMHLGKCTCRHLFRYGRLQIYFPLFYAAKIHLITSMNFDNKRVDEDEDFYYLTFIREAAR